MGTDGWMARLKCIVFDSKRKVSAGRNKMMHMADDENQGLRLHLYMLLVAIEVLSVELPQPVNGVGFKYLEYDDGCECGHVAWETEMVDRINARRCCRRDCNGDEALQTQRTPPVRCGVCCPCAVPGPR